MNEIEKRFDAALDLVRWLDARIAQQVEHQLEQRLAQEREYWRCTVSDLIAAEHEGLAALVEEERRKVIDWVKGNPEELRKIVAEVTDRISDRITAKLDRFAVPMRRPDDDGQPPPSTH